MKEGIAGDAAGATLLQGDASVLSLGGYLGRSKKEPFQVSPVTVIKQISRNGSAGPQSVTALLDVKLNGHLLLLPQGGVALVATAVLGNWSSWDTADGSKEGTAEG